MENENENGCGLTTAATLPKEITRLRLGLYTSDYSQPISLMRVMGPFAAMARRDRRLELVCPPLELPDAAAGRMGGQRLNWDWLMQCDAVFMLHPESDVQVHCASLAFQLGIPLWVEYVDDIFTVEGHNPGWKQRRNRSELAFNVRSITAWASVVTCVSEYNRQAILKGMMGEGEDVSRETRETAAGTAALPQTTGETPVALQLPDGFADKFVVVPEGCMWPPSLLPRRKLVSWRGLGSHGRDVDEALPHITAAARAFPEWGWMFGGDQEILEELGRRLSPICGKEKVLLAPYWPTPFEAMQAWAGQSPYLHIVPLADSAFNRSKSHLAWLEASAVGAAVIAPDHLPEWDQPGVIKYHHELIVGTDQDNLRDVLVREMGGFNEGLLHPVVHEARAAIYPDRTLKTMNQRRWAILRKLAERTFNIEHSTPNS